MTKTADLIVTKLENGPSTARDLSQSLKAVSYAAIRQTLSRLAKAGIVTKQGRGLYALPDCDNETPAADCDSTVEADGCDKPADRVVTDHLRAAIAEAFADYAALDDPHNSEAWA